MWFSPNRSPKTLVFADVKSIMILFGFHSMFTVKMLRKYDEYRGHPQRILSETIFYRLGIRTVTL